MKISTTSQYGLMAVGYVANHSKDGNVIAQTISQEYNIPLEYLLKILQYLVRAGILNSKRGPRGGFTMGKELDQITLLEIFEAIDGPSSNQVNLLEQAKKEHFAVQMQKMCDKAVAKSNEVLRNVTLADLINTAKK